MDPDDFICGGYLSDVVDFAGAGSRVGSKSFLFRRGILVGFRCYVLDDIDFFNGILSRPPRHILRHLRRCAIHWDVRVENDS